MANIKKISDLEQMQSLSGSSNVLIEEDGEAKRFPTAGLENTADRVTVIDETADDEHYPTAKAVYDLVQERVGTSGGGPAADFPTFEKVEGVVEYNEITKAVEVSTLEELKAYDGVAILKGYAQGYGEQEANANVNLLKVLVQPGDVIRDKLAAWWLPSDRATGLYHMAFYTAENTKIGSTTSVCFGGHASSNYLDIRENGVVIPDNCSYVLVNIRNSYWWNYTVDNQYQSTNGFTASIITKNADASLTAYDGTAVAPDYVSVGDGNGKTYYQAIDDVRLPRYENKTEFIGIASESNFGLVKVWSEEIDGEKILHISTEV